MIGQRLGPYTIEAELGSGGMGTVYRATGPEGVVALKVVHPHLLATPGFFKRFLREAEIGKAIHHENVVRTLDIDALLVEDKQVHYMVLEYVRGKSLRELLHDLGTVPETLLREIALQTAAGLAAIHEAGIIHRDLKPENILITEDHEIRIMDLGVAKLQEASVAITKEGHFAGSLLYAAPEQFQNDAVGPRADLYSLGVLLYELATGRHPFRSDDASAVIAAHLNVQPPRVRERSEDVSFFLSELIATLLAKRQAERFASARELHAILEESERSAWWTARSPALRREESRLPRIRVRRETALHGRGDDLRVLRDAWARAREGRGGTVLLEGEAGIGKTRLVDAFLRDLGGDDAHVLYGSYPPSGGLGGLSEAVIGKFGEVRLADALAPYLTVTPSLVPAFAAMLKHESPPTGAEPLRGDALQAVAVHLMRALAEERPTVWVVDDLQFAPRESRDVLLAMARAAEDHRVLLVAASRPGLEQSSLNRLESFQRIVPRRLGAREIIELLEDAFSSEDLAERLGVRIAKKSDGVPYFIFELIRGLKDAQLIRQLDDGSYVQTQDIEEIEVPSAVKDLIEGRMRGLSEDQRAILDVGAVCGMTFDPGLVAQVLEEKRVRVLRALAEIERRFGLVCDEGEAIRFDQNQIQEILYRGVPPHLRIEYHTLLAKAHAERCGDTPRGDDAVFLVHHYLRGRRPDQALPHLEPALEHLEHGYRNEAVLDLVGRALKAEGLLAGARRAEVLLRQAASLDLLGRRDAQRAALDEAVARADEVGEDRLRSRAQLAVGVLRYGLSEFEAARIAFEESLRRARAASDKDLEARATGSVGVAAWAMGRHAEARTHLERHCALAREIGDRRGEARATGNLGNVFWSLGQFENAREHHERARALAREVGDRGGEALATGNLGTVFSSLGRFAEAREHHDRRRALCREIGHRPGEAHATGNLGAAFLFLGRLAEAREHLERSRALCREIGDRRGEALASGNLGIVASALGRTEEAREHFERKRVLSRETSHRHGEANALAGLAKLAEAEGDPGAAIRLQGEVLGVWRELGDRSGEVEALIGLGRIEGDTTRLDEALALAQETTAPSTRLAATIERARHPGGNVDAALAVFAEHGERVTHRERMEARFRLWELTRDRAHLEEAYRLLTFLCDHAPGEDRHSTIENVPLHHGIVKAWEEQRGAGV